MNQPKQRMIMDASEMGECNGCNGPEDNDGPTISITQVNDRIPFRQQLILEGYKAVMSKEWAQCELHVGQLKRILVQTVGEALEADAELSGREGK